MPNSSSSRSLKAISLIPFFFFATTRLRTPRDVAYLVASSWVPAVWLVFRLSGGASIEKVGAFLAGYLAFIAFYEIGYFANDGWDARESAEGRRRISFSFGPAYAVIFIAVRLAAWLAIGFLFGWVRDWVWLACYAALAAAFAQHNLIASHAYRSASFYQLATLRFVAPIVALVPRPELMLVILSALIFYTYFRHLAYLDSKDLLAMPKRREPSFPLVQLIMLTPLVLLLAFVAQRAVVVELLLYFFVLFGLWTLLAARKKATQA